MVGAPYRARQRAGFCDERTLCVEGARDLVDRAVRTKRE